MTGTEQRSLRVLIADDHWVVRAALASLLRRLGEIDLHEAATGDEAIDAVKATPELDLLLLDLNMPGPSSIRTINTIRRAAPNLPIVMISVSEARSDVLRSLDNGAVGYIPKTADPDVILSTIERVLAGEVALPQRLLVRSEEEAAPAFSDDQELANVFSAFEAFTPRQREIFEHLASGAKNTEIAEALELSVNTVRVHIQAIASRMPHRNRAQIVAAASRWKERRAAS
ncbi:MAG: response regulator transcription factor [Pseudomonadota bacterium]